MIDDRSTLLAWKEEGRREKSKSNSLSFGLEKTRSILGRSSYSAKQFLHTFLVKALVSTITISSHAIHSIYLH